MASWELFKIWEYLNKIILDRNWNPKKPHLSDWRLWWTNKWKNGATKIKIKWLCKKIRDSKVKIEKSWRKFIWFEYSVTYW
jgi:hypothetical protein